MQEIVEGTTTFWSLGDAHITKDMEVFYNPVMRLNRDLSLLMLASMDWLRKKELRICFPMAASGVRATRMFNEIVPKYLAPGLVAINDLNPQAIALAQQNVERYGGKAEYTQREANQLLLSHKGFEYIDIDPYGTPNPFLDAAVRRLTRGGVLAVTATDTSALAGTYPRATARKYWAKPTRSWLMHEVGLRILIRKVQLIAAQYEKALVPILSVSADHYYRIFFKCLRPQGDIDTVLAQHGNLAISDDFAIGQGDVGPMWLGPLHDQAIVDRLRSLAEELGYEKARALLSTIADEARLDVLGFYDLHLLAKESGKKIPRRDELLAVLGERGARTHISPLGVKTTLSKEELLAYF